MIPEVGSPVIHAATTCFTAAATTDERSFARPATNCTVGAVNRSASLSEQQVGHLFPVVMHASTLR